jgi:hypothetical protein
MIVCYSLYLYSYNHIEIIYALTFLSYTTINMEIDNFGVKDIMLIQLEEIKRQLKNI